MFLRNAWYMAGWSETLTDRPLRLKIMNEGIALTRLADGAQRLWPEEEAPAPLAEAARAALAADAAANLTLDGEAWFIHPHNPPLRLIVVGAAHITQALAPMTAPLGFALTVIDPRRAFATEERFPGVTLIDAWPDEAMARRADQEFAEIYGTELDPARQDFYLRLDPLTW